MVESTALKVIIPSFNIALFNLYEYFVILYIINKWLRIPLLFFLKKRSKLQNQKLEDQKKEHLNKVQFLVQSITVGADDHTIVNNDSLFLCLVLNQDKKKAQLEKGCSHIFLRSPEFRHG